jgi:oligopeptide transport system ATP-binding protein
MSKALLDVRRLVVSFAARRRRLQVLTDVTFAIEPGETLGIVGESGSGKSTLARAVLRLGRGLDIHRMCARELRALRREMQIVFQDPFASLDPRMTVGASVAEPLLVHRPELTAAERAIIIARMLARVGLSPDLANRYPHEFSGGQCQRVAIARAVIAGPQLLVCDEPLSALDVSVQAQIVNLIGELKQEFGMSVLFISHNLAVVRRVASRILVLYLGRVMELAGRDALFAAPRHPYTRALLDAIPVLDPQSARAARPVPIGEAASPLDPPQGCVFHPRCPFVVERCRREIPVLENAGPGRQVACHRWRELSGEEN